METNSEIINFFAAYIKDEVGIVYQETNLYQLETRLKEIAQQLEFDNVDELYKSAKRRISPEMRLFILDIATNNETSFFRDPHIFKNIENIALDFVPALTTNKETFRIWSAACSRGQEIYTVAMTLDPIRNKLPNGFSILATDISERALDQAKSGKYSQLQIQRGLPIQNLVKYFKKEDENSKYAWQVSKELCKDVTFKSQNLLDSFTRLGSFHLILMRNVLIYQTIEKRKQILEAAYHQLVPGGYLILGAAESMIGVTDIFETVRLEKATVFRKQPALEKTA